MKDSIFEVESNLETLGVHVRMWRGLHNYTQQDLADRAHVSRQTVVNLEKGSGKVRLDDLMSILRILHLDRKVMTAIDPSLDEVARHRWHLTQRKRVR